jgi:hypothetical protein
MRTIFIEPVRQQVSVAEIEIGHAELRDLLGTTPHRAACLHNGDVVLAGSGKGSGFTMGGSRPIAGVAVVVGKSTRFREHRPAKSDASSIKRLVRWVYLNGPPS